MSADNLPNVDEVAVQSNSRSDQVMENQLPVYPTAMAQSRASTDPNAHLQMFMHPMFAELEQQVKEQEKILDKLNEEMEAERQVRRKKLKQAHISQSLKGSGKDLNAIMQSVEELLLYDIDDKDLHPEEKEEQEKHLHFSDIWKESPVSEDTEKKEKEIKKSPTPIPKLDQYGHAAVTAHSLGAYVSCLLEDHQRKFITKITADCRLWLSKMFRFNDCLVYYHNEDLDGLIKVCRLALYQTYPKYITEGFEALYSRPPVIYISSATMPGWSSYICQQLGLPYSSICSVPCQSTPGSETKMDVGILGKLIEDDIAAAKKPVALIAFAGTPTCGHVDQLEDLQELCKKHKIWMHIDGDNLATLALLHPPTSIQQARLGDSFTICIGKWFGIPALPYATLFKIADPALVHAASLSSFNCTLKLNCLPIWVVLQGLGIENIEQRITHACDLAAYLQGEIDKFKTIKQFSKEVNKNKDRPIRSITELLSKAITALLVVEMVTPTVVFRYKEDTSELNSVAVAPYAVGSGLDMDEDDADYDGQLKKKMQYYDALNFWLAGVLQDENPYVAITIVELPREGVCLKFAPLESAQVLGTEEHHLEEFVKCLRSNLEILDATVLNYEKFRIVAADKENLRIVEVISWAGLGAIQKEEEDTSSKVDPITSEDVCPSESLRPLIDSCHTYEYIPDEYLNHLNNLSDTAHQEINNLNAELVHRLKSTDSAFSLGYTDENTICVKFGLISEDTNVEELIALVQSVGKEVEESTKYIESLSELVMKGIEEANKDLKLENQHKLEQEGVLRQLPMIGSVINWWSPPPKNSVKGCSFNLMSGVITSSEDTYKNKMQVMLGDSLPASPRSRTTSGTGSTLSVSSQHIGIPLPEHGVTSQQINTPKSSKLPTTPTGPKFKTAGAIKAELVSQTSTEGDLLDIAESQKTPNGNLRLNLDSNEAGIRTGS